MYSLNVHLKPELLEEPFILATLVPKKIKLYILIVIQKKEKENFLRTSSSRKYFAISWFIS